MNKAFLMWQDNETRQWYPVGRLSYDGEEYSFVYTQGAERSPRFTTFGRMDNKNLVYKSRELFPLFANRVLPKTRPEYNDFVKWIGLSSDQATPFLILTRGGGVKATDSLTVHACPEKDKAGNYMAYFFCHGISHLPEDGQKRIETLSADDRIFPMFDVQNPYDAAAITMRTDDPATLIGYCPRYLTKDFKALLYQSENFKITVEKINREAPAQFRLLCKAFSYWPDGFSPCSGDEYMPLVNS